MPKHWKHYGAIWRPNARKIMRVIIAGSRTATDERDLEEAIASCLFKDQITEVVCGGARGADELGHIWATQNKIPIKMFLAEWGRLGKRAGFARNYEMAQYADGLIALWDGLSRGTESMIRLARSHDLKVHVHILGTRA